MSIDNTSEQFKLDNKMSMISEKYVLSYLNIKYPKAYKKIPDIKEYDFVIPEIDKTVELKTDVKSNDTGNLFIEFEYRGNPSGIITSLADFWFISDGIVIFGFQRKQLLELLESNKYKVGVLTGKYNGTKGMLITSPYNNYFNHIVHEIPKETTGHLKNLKKVRK